MLLGKLWGNFELYIVYKICAGLFLRTNGLQTMISSKKKKNDSFKIDNVVSTIIIKI